MARIVLAAISSGDFTRASQAPSEKNSGDRNMVSMTARKSPSVFRNVCAMRSTSACGGCSATKCRASPSEMNFAVEGWCARMSITFNPSSSPPPAGILWPSTVFSPKSCMKGAKTNSGFSGLRTVQPVKQRATAITSACV